MATLALQTRPRPVLEKAMTPLFIPLKGEYYDAFASGIKTEEFRKAGGRWNPRTCPIGRDVILSRGYGKKHRLRGYIVGFSDQPVSMLKQPHKQNFINCYGADAARAFVIEIELEATNDK